MPKLAACYIRVSTDDQLEFSPDSQLEKIQEFAKRNDYILPRDFIFIEHEGISGRKASKRAEFQRMIATAKIKPKPFDAILVWKFSRFARNREDSIVYKSMLRKELGIDVISISENVGDDKISVITEAIIEAMDEYYCINLGEEVRRGMTERAQRGKCNSIAPFGYKNENNTLVIVPEEAEIVRQVYDRYLNGWSMREITLWLRDMNIKTHRGGNMERRTVEYWLNNPVYKGYCRWTPDKKIKRDFKNKSSLIVKGEHEAIVSEEIWEKTQERIKEQKRLHPVTKYGTARAHSLTSIIKCPYCGRSFCYMKEGVLQCGGYTHGFCLHSQYTVEHKIFSLLISTIISDLGGMDFKLIRLNIEKPKSDKSNIENQIKRAEQRMERAKEAYQAGVDSIEEYAENKKSLQAEIEKLKTLLTPMEAEEPTEKEKKAYADDKLELVQKLTDPSVDELTKNKILRSFIKSATYYKAENKISVIYYC